MKGIYYLGIALLFGGALLFFARETGKIGEMPKFFQEHSVATSLMIAGVISLATIVISERMKD